MKLTRIVFFCGMLVFSVHPPGNLHAADSQQETDYRVSAAVEASEERIHSMGQPSRFEFYLSPLLVWDRDDDDDEFGGHLTGGIFRNLLNPIFGVGISAEGYAGVVDDDFDSGLRLLGTVKMFFLGAGIDHSFRHDETDLILSLGLPVKRGGLFGRGTSLRIDWLPTRDHSFNFGINIPLGNPYLGRTRTKYDQVVLPDHRGPDASKINAKRAPALTNKLDQIREIASWIKIFTTPFFDQDLSDDEDVLAEFRDKVHRIKDRIQRLSMDNPAKTPFDVELLNFNRALVDAFNMAINSGKKRSGGSDVGQRITQNAKKILLEEILLPYNRLLGLSKKNDSLLGYGKTAQKRFETWLTANTLLTQDQKNNALYVFENLIRILDNIRQDSQTVWGGSNLVWMPLHYGLDLSDYDSQQKLDALLEKITEDKFVAGNDVYYVVNEQFQPELARMIYAAEDYHVLWIHDYRGITPAGNPDRLGFAQTLFGYLEALIKRVREYDQRGKLPLYLILIDQIFYEDNQGRIWLQLLENPLEHHLRLPPEYADWEQQIKSAQAQLQSAVKASKRLQAQANIFGHRWLTNRVKVHVNVINPSDFSFRSAHLIDNMPIAPDNLMRDHRKVAFYDVTELDPGKGEAIYSGMGIGEHYAGPTWEDRAVLAAGPVLLSLKDAARQVLVQQGFSENEIPKPLRKLPKPADYTAKVQALMKKGWDATMMDVHNQTGFRPKPINALKAALYSLMPAKSTIVVPDSLWNAPFWGGMLAGAALRGCRVLVISPSLEHAPSAGFPQMSRANELFTRLIVAEHVLSNEISAAGGMLKIGIYNRESEVGDLRAKIKEFNDGVEKNPFIRTIFPFDDSVYAALHEFKAQLSEQDLQPTYYTDDAVKRKPKLHLKTNFFASAKMQDLLAWDGWDDVMRNYLRYRSSLSYRKDEYVDVKDVPEALNEATDKLLAAYWNSLSMADQQNVIYYLMVGSQNQDYRGIIMDGEVAAVISGYFSLIGLMDFFFMSGLTTWIDDVQKLDQLLPPQSGWRRWLGRFIMKAL